ncbi:hypothetical protein KFK09_006330 [Dendrobium nobile]|uniref:Uncharacterized protein n=1 Tax=Dendrobium nobile TaxID=94219 RepID=A0A8T3BTF9_DENNO|nr:hypothetical protein KFK09_006330 [Dendrobium nobile]
MKDDASSNVLVVWMESHILFFMIDFIHEIVSEKLFYADTERNLSSEGQPECAMSPVPSRVPSSTKLYRAWGDVVHSDWFLDGVRRPHRIISRVWIGEVSLLDLVA